MTNRRDWRMAVVAIGTALGALTLQPAQAQQADTGNAGDAGNTLQLQQITVTAEKRDENLQSAPAAITSVTGDELTTLGISTIEDIGVLFPSARFEQIGPGSHLYVRGIGAEQDRIAVDQLVNMSLDGILLPREMDSIAQVDVRDVELLPGPQGTLYGASSVGGVIGIQANRPTDGWRNNLAVEAGNYAALHVTDAQNAEVNDALSLRGAVDYTKHSPYQTSGAWTADTTTARLSALYRPSEVFSAYIWGLAYNDRSLSQTGGALTPDGQWIPSNNPWDDANACITLACNGVLGRPNDGNLRDQANDYILAGQFDWKLSGVTITDIASVLNSDSAEGMYDFVFVENYITQHHQVSNELKAASNDAGPAQWLAGLYLNQDKGSQSIDLDSYIIPDYTQQSVAPYAQLNYSFRDDLRGTLGARYSWTRKQATFDEPNALPQSSATWGSVDWKAGLEYDLGPAAMAYLTAQTGSSPGTLDAQDPVDGQPNKTKLTRLYSLTGGWKSRLFNNRVQLNNELYYYDYQDFLIQTVVCSTAITCTPFNNVFLNAPKLTSWGDQFDLRWLITPADQVSVDAAFSSVKTGHWITDAGADLSGQTLMEAPQTTVGLTAQHAFSMSNDAETILRVDSYLNGGYWGDFETQPGDPVHFPSQHQAAFTSTGLSLTYHAPQERWTFGLWAKNLENKAQLGPGAAFSFGSKIGGGAELASAPRTYGVRFTANLDAASH